jgi:hypothetical protein
MRLDGLWEQLIRHRESGVELGVDADTRESVRKRSTSGRGYDGADSASDTGHGGEEQQKARPERDRRAFPCETRQREGSGQTSSMQFATRRGRMWPVKGRKLVSSAMSDERG